MAQKKLDLRKELETMRSKYIKKPLRDLKIKRPYWMGRHDGLYAVFSEKETLLSSGQIYFAQVVQANEFLFDRTKKEDCPALFLYTTDPSANADPTMLKMLAHKLFGYKNMDPEEVPEEWREAARIITDEMDRSTMKFTVPGPDGPIEVLGVAVMVFREYLPEKTIIGRTIPILAIPDSCESVLILPKKYWSKDFIKAWVNGEI